MEVEEVKKHEKNPETTRIFVRHYLKQILKDTVSLKQNANEGRCLLGSNEVTSLRVSAI